MFTLLEQGFDDLQMPDHPNRGLFWVRLSPKASPETVMLVVTAHFPWKECATEVATGIDQRRVAAKRTVEILCSKRHTHTRDLLFFGGDMNDDWVPVSLLREGLGLQDVFAAIDCPPPHTHPTRPSHPREERQPDHTLDWLLTESMMAPGRCKVLSAHCKRVRGGQFPPPSDHMPVLCVCELTPA
jgi:hypothetical protein